MSVQAQCTLKRHEYLSYVVVRRVGGTPIQQMLSISNSLTPNFVLICVALGHAERVPIICA